MAPGPLIRILFSLCGAVLVAACVRAPLMASTPPEAATAGGAEPLRPPGELLVERDAWSPLSTAPERPWSGHAFGMYTYVLYKGPIGTRLDSADKASYERLKRLLAAIARPEYAAKTTGTGFHRTANLFLIPGAARSDGSVAYDTILARRYLDWFGKVLAADSELQRRIVNENGPFLFATYRPLHRIVARLDGNGGFIVDAAQPILIVDLSKTSERRLPEVVRTFKEHVTDHRLAGVQAFEPLRLSLANLLLEFAEAVPVVYQAVAGTCRMAGGEKVCAE